MLCNRSYTNKPISSRYRQAARRPSGEHRGPPPPTRNVLTSLCSGAAARGLHRPHAVLDEVLDFPQAQVAVHDVSPDAIAPGDVAASGIGDEGVEVPDPALDRRLIAEEAFLQERRPVAMHDRGNLVERIFRMVLDPPEKAPIELDGCRLHVAGAVG